MESQNQEFKVTDPAKIGGSFTSYTVTGVDDQGQFSVMRRYKEFHAIWWKLFQKWIGIYIPKLPDKKLTNVTNADVVEERRFLLDKWFKECAQLDYIRKSAEFKIFIARVGDVEKELKAMPEERPAQ